MLASVLDDVEKLQALLDTELDGSLQALTLTCAHLHLRMELVEQLEAQVERVRGKGTTELDMLDEQVGGGQGCCGDWPPPPPPRAVVGLRSTFAPSPAHPLTALRVTTLPFNAPSTSSL